MDISLLYHSIKLTYHVDEKLNHNNDTQKVQIL